MAALLVLPAVAFAVLVTIMYEDRLLPQSESAQEQPAPTEPAAGAVLASSAADTTTAEETAPLLSPVADAEPGTETAAVPAPVAHREPADVTVPPQAGRTPGRQCQVGRDAALQGRPRIHRPAIGSAAPRRAAVPSRSTPELHFEGAVSVPRH